jgi:hypothetical protein
MYWCMHWGNKVCCGFAVARSVPAKRRGRNNAQSALSCWKNTKYASYSKIFSRTLGRVTMPRPMCNSFTANLSLFASKSALSCAENGRAPPAISLVAGASSAAPAHKEYQRIVPVDLPVAAAGCVSRSASLNFIFLLFRSKATRCSCVIRRTDHRSLFIWEGC